VIDLILCGVAYVILKSFCGYHDEEFNFGGEIIEMMMEWRDRFIVPHKIDLPPGVIWPLILQLKRNLQSLLILTNLLQVPESIDHFLLFEAFW